MVDVPFEITLRKHPRSGHTWMVEGLVLVDVEVSINVSSPSLSAEVKQRISEYIVDAVNRKQMLTENNDTE